MTLFFVVLMSHCNKPSISNDRQHKEKYKSIILWLKKKKNFKVLHRYHGVSSLVYTATINRLPESLSFKFISFTLWHWYWPTTIWLNLYAHANDPNVSPVVHHLPPLLLHGVHLFRFFIILLLPNGAKWMANMNHSILIFFASQYWWFYTSMQWQFTMLFLFTYASFVCHIMCFRTLTPFTI